MGVAYDVTPCDDEISIKIGSLLCCTGLFYIGIEASLFETNDLTSPCECSIPFLNLLKIPKNSMIRLSRFRNFSFTLGVLQLYGYRKNGQKWPGGSFNVDLGVPLPGYYN